MSVKPSITVAGAGALGLTTALALADAGCKVTVFDPAAMGGNASGVAAGMLAPVFESVLDPQGAGHLGLLLAARDLWPALAARIGVGLDRSGAAAVGTAAFLERADAGMRGLGLYPTLLPRRAMDGMAPGLGSEFHAAVLTREDWRIEPVQALAALRQAAETAGVMFQPRAATGFEGAEQLVIATGAGRDLAALSRALSQVSPIKGQIATMPTPSLTGLALRLDGAYAVAGQSGLMLGATMEAGVDDARAEPAAVRRFVEVGRRLFPTLAEAPFTVQAGVRAATPDGLPLVGRGAHPGLLLATGARRNGWLLAPLVARIIAACVTEGEAGPYADRLDPQRFSQA